MLVPVLTAALYLIDQYQFEAHYSQAIWMQASTAGQKYQDELKIWWRSRG